ncbi:VOC family protein [Cytobacillus sp. FJAT-54145]|uniref:VOC family protein n=1 Tax=Cytobacillus spartinae TaxID=3299023 RepID=A0ABW6K790_9BACI
MLNKVCVLTIKVRDLKESLEFYTNVLDFKVSKQYGEKIVSLVHNEVPIVLEEVETVGVGRNQVLLGILSEDIEKDFRQLKDKGVKVIFDEPMPCPPGRYFIIEDPNGNQLEIVEFSNMN